MKKSCIGLLIAALGVIPATGFAQVKVGAKASAGATIDADAEGAGAKAGGDAEGRYEEPDATFLHRCLLRSPSTSVAVNAENYWEFPPIGNAGGLYHAKFQTINKQKFTVLGDPLKSLRHALGAASAPLCSRPSSASTKSSGENSCRSSGRSPNPT